MLKTKNPNRSRRKSYEKKFAGRLGQKERAVERARVREAKAVENGTPPKTKTPWRGPRSKPAPGTYALQTLFNGGMGCGMLLFAFLFISATVTDFGLIFLIVGLLFMGNAVHSFLHSRGGW